MKSTNKSILKAIKNAKTIDVECELSKQKKDLERIEAYLNEESKKQKKSIKEIAEKLLHNPHKIADLIGRNEDGYGLSLIKYFLFKKS
tara:strand:- start:380 stop:643 length:264 start_codon:yes stop_codon:yes gene_type:complete